MSIISYLMSMATTFIILALVMACVIKTFQVATDVREIKDAIQDLRRNVEASAPPAVPPSFAALHQNPPSPEELVRAVNAQSYGDIT